MTISQRGAEDYGTAIRSLQQASQGSYRGPRISPAALGGALGSIEGIDTAALIEHFGAAAGNSETRGLRERLLPKVLSMLGQAAAGAVGGMLGDIAGDWFDNRRQTEELAEGSRDAAEAVDTVVTDAEAAMSAVLSRALETLDLLLGHLATIDPGQYPGQFRGTVKCAADIIDQAGEMLTGTCTERDQVIGTCYEQLLETGKQICEQPTTQPPPEVVEGEPAQVKPPAPGATTEPTPPPKLNVPTEPGEPTPPPKILPESAPEPEPPVAKPDPDTTPAALPEEAECPPAPIPEEACGKDCSGALGAIGSGVALLAIGFVVQCLTEAVEYDIPETPPEPEPEPDLAEVPEPPPPPKKIPAPAPEPVPDLAEVPEPPPPPKQQPEAAPAAVTPPPAPAPEAPAPAPAPTPVPAPDPEPAPEPVGVARKAGTW